MGSKPANVTHVNHRRILWLLPLLEFLHLAQVSWCFTPSQPVRLYQGKHLAHDPPPPPPHTHTLSSLLCVPMCECLYVSLSSILFVAHTRTLSLSLSLTYTHTHTHTHTPACILHMRICMQMVIYCFIQCLRVLSECDYVS